MKNSLRNLVLGLAALVSGCATVRDSQVQEIYEPIRNSKTLLSGTLEIAYTDRIHGNSKFIRAYPELVTAVLETNHDPLPKRIEIPSECLNSSEEIDCEIRVIYNSYTEGNHK